MTSARPGAFDRGDCLHGQLWWFDEYDVDLGNLLAPLQSDSPAPGVLRRHFTYGQVIVKLDRQNPDCQRLFSLLSQFGGPIILAVAAGMHELRSA